MTKTVARGKIFSKDIQLLQLIGDAIQNEFSGNSSVSRPLPADRDDYHIMVTIYREAR